MGWLSDFLSGGSSGSSGKSSDGSVFSSKDRDDGKTEHFFNRGSEDGGRHGHVVTSNDGQTTHYARDVDGHEYVDDSKK